MEATLSQKLSIGYLLSTTNTFLCRAMNSQLDGSYPFTELSIGYLLSTTPIPSYAGP